MKTVNYGDQVVEYDENQPCILCGEPVLSASSSGTIVCPWCDMGKSRRKDGLMPPMKARFTHEWYQAPFHPKAIQHYGMGLIFSLEPKWEPAPGSEFEEAWREYGRELEELAAASGD